MLKEGRKAGRVQKSPATVAASGEELMERAGGNVKLLEMLYGLIWVVGTQGRIL